jgi:hypothetical protein
MDHLPHLEALQFGYANAATLQAKTGIPAIVFGLVQFGLLFAIYRSILRKEARMAQAREQAAAPVAAPSTDRLEPAMARDVDATPERAG